MWRPLWIQSSPAGSLNVQAREPDVSVSLDSLPSLSNVVRSNVVSGRRLPSGSPCTAPVFYPPRLSRPSALALPSVFSLQDLASRAEGYRFPAWRRGDTLEGPSLVLAESPPKHVWVGRSASPAVSAAVPVCWPSCRPPFAVRALPFSFVGRVTSVQSHEWTFPGRIPGAIHTRRRAERIPRDRVAHFSSMSAAISGATARQGDGAAAEPFGVDIWFGTGMICVRTRPRNRPDCKCRRHR